MQDLVENRLDAIRADRTAHQLRLARLLPDLVSEFEGVRSDAEIRACADAILADYVDVPVRSFVMTIAHRRTRDCLRSERCDAARQCLDQTSSGGRSAEGLAAFALVFAGCGAIVADASTTARSARSASRSSSA